MSNQEVSLLRNRILTSFASIVARPAVPAVSLVSIVRPVETTVEPLCEFDHVSKFARSQGAGIRTPGILAARVKAADGSLEEWDVWFPKGCDSVEFIDIQRQDTLLISL